MARISTAMPVTRSALGSHPATGAGQRVCPRWRFRSAAACRKPERSAHGSVSWWLRLMIEPRETRRLSIRRQAGTDATFDFRCLSTSTARREQFLANKSCIG